MDRKGDLDSMDEEVIYGTIGMLADGEYDPEKQYDLLNVVSFDGSSYVVHTKPPIGTLPTNLDYWQVSALGTSKATANSVGTVKPDGETTEVGTDGSMSVKTATQEALGLVKGSNGVKVGADGSIDVNTLFEQATELANIIAGEAISTALGKIAKSIAITMNLNENALLKSMLTNIDANNQNKIPTSAFVHTLYERIGMGEELAAGANLTAAFNALNSNLTVLNAKEIQFKQAVKPVFASTSDLSSGAEVMFNITFDKAFSAVPTVTFTLQVSGNNFLSQVSGVTKTGFTGYIRNPSSSSIPVTGVSLSYIAMC